VMRANDVLPIVPNLQNSSAKRDLRKLLRQSRAAGNGFWHRSCFSLRAFEKQQTRDERDLKTFSERNFEVLCVEHLTNHPTGDG